MLQDRRLVNMADAVQELCVVCRTCASSGGGCRKLGSKGLTTLNDVSRLRADGLYQELSTNANHFVHDKYYRTYTAKKNIQLAQKTSRLTTIRESAESPTPALIYNTLKKLVCRLMYEKIYRV